MSEARSPFSDIDHNVAANVRHFRDAHGLSQDELAQRMTDRGFGFTQATIWKIESGQRTVKISEVVALGEALELRSWTYLTAQPEISRHHADLQSSNAQAHQAFAALKAAATDYLEAQINVLVAVREAQDTGLNTEPWVGWLDTPAERAVIEARVEWDRHDEVLEQQRAEADELMEALRAAGYKPLRPEDVVIEGGDTA